MRTDTPTEWRAYDTRREPSVFRKLKTMTSNKRRRQKGAIFVEYILLLTIVGIGVIVGLATVRSALINELFDLANAINAINS